MDTLRSVNGQRIGKLRSGHRHFTPVWLGTPHRCRGRLRKLGGPNLGPLLDTRKADLNGRYVAHCRLAALGP